MYEALCGVAPFDRVKSDIAYQFQIFKQPVEPMIRRPDLEISSRMSAFAMKALKKDPERRLRSMDEMMECMDKCY